MNVLCMLLGMNHEESNECIDSQLKKKDPQEEAEMLLIDAVEDDNTQVQDYWRNAVVYLMMKK